MDSHSYPFFRLLDNSSFMFSFSTDFVDQCASCLLNFGQSHEEVRIHAIRIAAELKKMLACDVAQVCSSATSRIAQRQEILAVKNLLKINIFFSKNIIFIMFNFQFDAFFRNGFYVVEDFVYFQTNFTGLFIFYINGIAIFD